MKILSTLCVFLLVAVAYLEWQAITVRSRASRVTHSVPVDSEARAQILKLQERVGEDEAVIAALIRFSGIVTKTLLILRNEDQFQAPVTPRQPLDI